MVLFSAKKCVDEPDMGVGTGVSVIWDNRRLFKSGISYVCKDGQVFDEIYDQDIWGNCTTQIPSSSDISWKYNSGNKIPKCIRKFVIICFAIVVKRT
jgi:hypothetical protein